MRNIILITCIVAALFGKTNLSAQGFFHRDSIPSVDVIADAPETIQAYDTAVVYYQRNENGLVMPPVEWEPLNARYTFADTMFYNPAFLPVVFDGQLLPDNLSFLPSSLSSGKPLYHLIPADSTFAPLLEKSRQIKELRRNYFSSPKNMPKMEYSQSILSAVAQDKRENVRNVLQELITKEDPIKPAAPNVKQRLPKRQYWIKNGEHRLEIAQNHISDNWSKGGSSSYYVQSYQKLLLNYAKDKVTFNNTIEWRLGFQSTSGDTLRDVRINTDNFRYYGVFGYKAYENWSYSATLEAITQFFNNYRENDKTRRSSFLSPLDVNAGLGMTYSLNKSFKSSMTKKLRLSLNLAPLSMNFRHIMDDKVDETSFKLNKGLHSKISWGSLVNADMTFNFNSFLTFTSRFKYLTDYESVVSESENRLDFSLNRYFTTSFYLYARYDENSKRDSKLGFLQFNELLSFGLNYKW
ncbi:MAG: DUF3078 domain-containing protein [Prevotella sp.]|nr:DUF3078 domain-containing protein [Prevotella sp.]